MTVRDMDIALRLGNVCPFCEQPWQLGDRAQVIGNVNEHHESELRFAHLACLLYETTGIDQRP